MHNYNMYMLYLVSTGFRKCRDNVCWFPQSFSQHHMGYHWKLLTSLKCYHNFSYSVQNSSIMLKWKWVSDRFESCQLFNRVIAWVGENSDKKRGNKMESTPILEDLTLLMALFYYHIHWTIEPNAFWNFQNHRPKHQWNKNTTNSIPMNGYSK